MSAGESRHASAPTATGAAAAFLGGVGGALAGVTCATGTNSLTSSFLLVTTAAAGVGFAVAAALSFFSFLGLPIDGDDGSAGALCQQYPQLRLGCRLVVVVVADHNRLLLVLPGRVCSHRE